MKKELVICFSDHTPEKVASVTHLRGDGLCGLWRNPFGVVAVAEL